MDARPTVPAKSRPGRPRALDDDAERRLLLDAGYRVMRQNGFEDASVGDVLAEAGLSTRAFYRHFASKDDLVLAMSRRDAARIAARIDERLETAATSIDALHAWVDEVLAIAYEPRRAARV
ncbi:MAG: TetR/AcrR family transcriptional regulator, partial [Actinobacteria bacterium]